MGLSDRLAAWDHQRDAETRNAMSQPIAQTADTALFWKGIQYAGIKVIFFVRLLILARLLAPDDFGLLAISMVAIDVMTRMTDFGLSPALVQRESSERLHYDTAWTVGLVRASLVTGIVLLVAPLVADLFNDPRATNLIRVLAFRPLFESLASIKMAELIRNLRFRDLTFIKLPEALVNTIVAVALAPTIGVWTLVAGVLAGQLAVLIISYILAPHRPRLSFNREAARSSKKGAADCAQL
jgi:O-antigen/teichoic acid export membrane protein